MDRAHRRPLARPAGGLRGLEQRLPAVQPVGRRGVWDRIFAAMAADPDLGYPIPDSTIVRARQHAAPARGGGPKGAEDQAIGRSRGGPGTKLRPAVRGPGRPVRALPTAGRRGDAPQAPALLGTDRPGVVPADAARDADRIRRAVAAAGAAAVIPGDPSRAREPPSDKAPYRERHLAECRFPRLERFRRGATRCGKTARNYRAVVTPAATILWLR